MKSYKTYRECKIANPECEVAVVTGCDEFTPPLGEFIAVLKSDGLSDGYAFADESKSGSPNIGDGYYKICNPADHCMTVKEFLDAGYRFEVGDALLFPNDVEQVQIVGSTACHACFIDVDAANCRSMVDHKIYILRAVALEWLKRADDADREALSRIGAQLHTVHFNKKPRTKVEYVKVTDSIWHLESDFNAGDLFAFDGGSDYVQVETEGDFTLSHSADNLFRRIETPMTEREAFIEEAMSNFFNKSGVTHEIVAEMFDSGKFKLVN